MYFSFSFVAKKKRKKSTKRKRKHAIVFYALTSVDKMDVASRACTFTLTIVANRYTFATRKSFSLIKKNKNKFYSFHKIILQYCKIIYSMP